MKNTSPSSQERHLKILPIVEASYKNHQPGGISYEYYIKVRGTAVANEMASKTETLWLRALQRAKLDKNGRPILELQ